MRPVYLLDTGPLVAFVNRRDKHHEWARASLASIAPPLLTCEGVISEACFLLQHAPGGPLRVLDLVGRGLIRIPYVLGDDAGPVAKLLERYSNVPMSLADACLVRMTELLDDAAVMTVDADFRIYRRSGRNLIPLIAPEHV